MNSDSYRILPGSNPFVVHSPEDIPADEVRKLFVDVLSDFSKFENPGHAMLHGPRGSGKSMILRYLQPDCQVLKRACSTQDLPYYAVYVGVKRSELGLTELRRFQEQSIDFYLLEHLMVMQVLYRFLVTVESNLTSIDLNRVKGLQVFYDECFLKEMQFAGVENIATYQRKISNCADLIKAMFEVCNEVTRNISIYLKRLGMNAAPYVGPICSYNETLLGIFDGFKGCDVISRGPIYVMVDDADLLQEPLTQILNSWIASRTTANVCIKATTQYRYKTFRTPSGNSVEAMHDYVELDSSHIYTSKTKRYYTLIEEIVRLRLDAAGLNPDGKLFFPVDKKQEAWIEVEEQRLRDEWPVKGRGAKISDDAIRYARPNYIRHLRGTSKSGSTYSYAGFEQLINVSSGVYRFFLAPAADMYEAQKEKNREKPVIFIDPDIQNKEIKDEANRLLYKRFDDLTQDEDANVVGSDKVQSLQNLVLSLGGIFSLILNSDRSERRVTSIALTNQPTSQIFSILKLGVQTGYLAESTLGNKEGTGRTRRYILTRRLAPAFTLDPYGFAGYLFMTNAELELCMRDPRAAIRKFETNRLGEESVTEQQGLFEEEDF